MTYTSGILNHKIVIWNRGDSTTTGDYGTEAGDYEETKSVWAAVDWSRGTRALRQGALDAYDTIMVRCRYDEDICKESRIEFEDKMYIIESFHSSRRDNTIQMTCIECTV